MRYGPLGRSGIDVSCVGLGANNFGGRLDERESTTVIRAALDLGVNLIDTADVYNAGRSEEIVGRAIRGRRDEVVVATKAGMASEEGMHRGGLAANHLRWCVEQSLRRLGVDHIDLLQLHIADPWTPISDTLITLDDLVTAGTLRAVGCSNFWAWEVAEAVTMAELREWPAFASVSAEWSLLHREPERELLPAARSLGFGLLPYRPLAQGFLTGKYREGAVPEHGSRFDLVPAQAELRLSDDNFAVLERLSAFATAHGCDLPTLAFGYLLGHDEVASVVTGASNAAQMTANVLAASHGSTGVVSELGELLPALGGHLLGLPALRPGR